LISLRSRELKIRLLDWQKIKDNRIFWQLTNTLGPLLLVFTGGIIFLLIRRKKYTQL